MNLGNRERRISHMQALSVTLSLPPGEEKNKLRRATSPENNGVRKHRAHWAPSLVLEAGAGMEPAEVERAGPSPQGERSGDSESIEPACDANPLLFTKPKRDGNPPFSGDLPPHINLLAGSSMNFI
jgi:hypothetical protein